MKITSNWDFARAEVDDTDGVGWIAEARARTGTWVIRQHANDFVVIGLMVPLDEDSSMLLSLSEAQRKTLDMSDDTYQRLNVSLRLDRIARREVRA